MEFYASDRATYEKFADGKEKDISEEIPFELPQGWAWARLADLTDSRILNDGDWIVSSDMSDNGGVKLLQLGSVGYGVYVDKGFKHITESKYNELGCTAIHPGYLLINRMIGDNLLACILPTIEGKIITAVDICWVAPSQRYDIKWVLFVVLSHWFQKVAKSLGAGEGRVRISKGNLIKIVFPLPPLAEQKRIVAKIEALFAYAEKIGKASDGISQASQRLNKKIFDLAIRGQLVPQDPNDEPASKLIKCIEAVKKATEKGRKSSRTAASDRPAYETNPPFDIPDSWEWVKLGNLVKIIAGVSYQKDDVTTSGVRILRGGNIKEDANIHLFDDDVFLPLSYANEESTIHSGDIVIVASTGSSTVIGRPAVAKESLPGIQIGAFLRIVRPVVDEVESWMPVLFLGDYYRRHIRGKSKGTNIKNLKAEYLSDLVIPLPPVAEQKRIVAKIEELRAMTRSITK